MLGSLKCLRRLRLLGLIPSFYLAWRNQFACQTDGWSSTSCQIVMLQDSNNLEFPPAWGSAFPGSLEGPLALNLRRDWFLNCEARSL